MAANNIFNQNIRERLNDMYRRKNEHDASNGVDNMFSHFTLANFNGLYRDRGFSGQNGNGFNVTIPNIGATAPVWQDEPLVHQPVNVGPEAEYLQGATRAPQQNQGDPIVTPPPNIDPNTIEPAPTGAGKRGRKMKVSAEGIEDDKVGAEVHALIDKLQNKKKGGVMMKLKTFETPTEKAMASISNTGSGTSKKGREREKLGMKIKGLENEIGGKRKRKGKGYMGFGKQSESDREDEKLGEEAHDLKKDVEKVEDVGIIGTGKGRKKKGGALMLKKVGGYGDLSGRHVGGAKKEPTKRKPSAWADLIKRVLDHNNTKIDGIDKPALKGVKEAIKFIKEHNLYKK